SATPSANGGLDSELDVLNQEIHQHIKAHVSAEKYATFFESTFRLAGLEADALTFSVSTQFIKIMIEGNYLETIKSITHELLNRPFIINLQVGGPLAPVSSNKKNILNGLRPQAAVQPAQEPDRPKSVKDVKFTLNLTPTRDDLMSK